MIAAGPEQVMRLWQDDALAFVHDNFKTAPGWTGPDDWQSEALAAVSRGEINRVAMKACKGPGKTCLLAWIVWWFMGTRYQANVGCTSITGQNLKDGLWKELSKWKQYSDFLEENFEVTSQRIAQVDHPKDWFVSAKPWPKTADATSQADTLSGFHGDFLMFILDEVGGIPDSVMAAAEAGLANASMEAGREAKIVIAGNPTHLSGPLWRACSSEAHLWHMVQITGDPDDPMRSPRISVEWARQQIEKYGIDNPWVQVNVFGNFPQASMNSLLGPEDIQKAMKVRWDQDAVDNTQHRLGIDVARFGDDRTVLIRRQGLLCHEPVILREQRTTEIAAVAAQMIHEHDVECTFVDDSGGWGGGVIDQLLMSGISPIPVNFSGKPVDPRYFNKRAEMWFEMANWIKRGGHLPKLGEITRELSSVEYNFKNGKFILEDKAHIKARLGYSPDIADALGLTFALPDSPSWAGGVQQPKHKWDYDPLEDEDEGRWRKIKETTIHRSRMVR